MGFDPRRWRPSSGSRPLTTNVEALLAENDALRREVRSLRLQLEAFLQADVGGCRSWDSQGGAPQADAAAAPGRQKSWTSDEGPAATTSARQGGGSWSSSARSRASRTPWSSTEPPRSRVTVGSSHGLSADLVERWGRSLARHPRWQELRIGPPGGLRGLEEELRRHWWNPDLSLEQEMDRRSPGLGAELSEALRGPHSRVRWAVRAAFALYGPRAPEWLSEDPLRVVEELLRRVQQLQQRSEAGPRRGTRTANTSGADPRSTETAGSAAGSRHGQQAGGRRGEQQHGHRAQSAGSEQRRQQRAAGGSGGGRSTGGRSNSAGTAASADARSQALALLGLEPGASAAAIKRAYRRLAKSHHPDLGGDAEAFRRLDAAYRSLL